MKKKSKLRNDILLIAALLVLGAVLLLTAKSCKERATEVRVEADGIEIGRYPLSQDATYSLNGGTNILVIENGAAFLKEANCPDKLCVRQGKISLQGQCIVCLPNKLTVTAVGGKPDTDIVM